MALPLSLSLTNPSAADSGQYAPVTVNPTTGAFNFGFGASQSTAASVLPKISIELIAILGLFAFLLMKNK